MPDEAEAIILASQSPRRRELLTRAGVAFRCQPADVCESPLPGESPESLVRRLSALKAGQVAATCPGRIVLGADTVVVLDGQVLGKPRDLAAARRMLAALSGRTHDVLTGVCLIGRDGAAQSWVSRTAVNFRTLDAEAIERYLACVDVLDKAGAYAIQEHGEMVVAGVSGSWSNVVGLPVEEVVARLADMMRGDELNHGAGPKEASEP